VAGEEVMAAKGAPSRELTALLFLGGVYVAFDGMSTINSSPWTHETFGQDPEKAESQQWYVRQAMGVSLVLGGTSSFIGGTPWPLIGTVAANTYLFWIYRRAYHKAKGS
jgi:hypothetical protein